MIWFWFSNRMNDVPEQQNPLLDIPNKVDQDVLEKFGQKAGDAIDPRRGEGYTSLQGAC